jgi:hypothetical protein
MSRTVTVTLAECIAAAAQLRRLLSLDGLPTGLPAPPFDATVTVSDVMRQLAQHEARYGRQVATLQQTYAMRHPDESAVIVTDANGKIQNGAMYIADPPKFNEEMASLAMREVEVSALSLMDLVYHGARRLPDTLPALLPLVEDRTISEDGRAWIATYDAALARHTQPPTADPNAAPRVAPPVVTPPAVVPPPTAAVPAPAAPVAPSVPSVPSA